MTTLNEITYVDWQQKINSIGEVVEGAEEINQSIAIILTTKKGSDPHRPDFGSDIYLYLDYPVNEISAHIIREATDSITKWESRITINSITVNLQESNISIYIDWTLKETITKGITQVSYVKAA